MAGGAGAVPQPAMAPRLFMCLGPGCRLGHPLRLFLHPGFGVTVWAHFLALSLLLIGLSRRQAGIGS